MIKPGEIQNKAREVSVRDQQIEKDYILSWILQGLAQHEKLAKAIVFKGGTVLKKGYFEDYRFSEDLDFTLLNKELSNEQIFLWFEKIFEYVREEANIPLKIIDNDEHEDGGINFYISYVGPLGGQGSHKKVKVDISKNEQLEFDTVIRNMITAYSDLDDHQLLCYSLEEVLVEKMRSVMQRLQARDYYDIWYLLEIHGMNINCYTREFIAKCESKGLDANQFTEKLENRKASYRGRWQSSLGDQIKDLPDFDKVAREMQRHIRKLNL
jgi:predicted nucleotidyltransferase component of viral defense system